MAEVYFICQSCGTEIKHNHTAESIFKIKYIELKCQNCGHESKYPTTKIIDKVRQASLTELKKKGYKLS